MAVFHHRVTETPTSVHAPLEWHAHELDTKARCVSILLEYAYSTRCTSGNEHSAHSPTRTRSEHVDPFREADSRSSHREGYDTALPTRPPATRVFAIASLRRDMSHMRK